MKDIHMIYFFSSLIVLFGIVRFFLIKFLREATNMKKNIKLNMGKPVAISSWGNASINGVRVTGGIRIAEYQNGYLLELKKIYGGSQLWLPKGKINILGFKKGRLLIPSIKEIESEDNKVTLYGKLAHKIA